MKRILKALLAGFALLVCVPVTVEAKSRKKVKMKRVKREKALLALQESLQQVEKSKSGGTSKKNRKKKKEQNVQKLNEQITMLSNISDVDVFTKDGGKTYEQKPSTATTSN